jgi:uncharacterized repeat protein (TIGR02543 family)
MARVSVFLIVVVLIAGMAGCAQPAQYNLTISTTEGGEITTPGDGTFSYDEGRVVPLVALPHAGYQFAGWTGDVGTVANVNTATTTVTMNDDYSITATFAVMQHSLVIHTTEGGSVTAPGENAYTYDKGEVVNLVAVADEGYLFINWTGDVSSVADVNAASTTITMNGGYSITANFAGAIRDWYGLDAIRNNLDGSYVLMNDLDSTTLGYRELASSSANGGKGWLPIGRVAVSPVDDSNVTLVDAFVGAFDGQQYEIKNLFVNRPAEDGVGLFGSVDKGGALQNIKVISATVIGELYVGGLIGCNQGVARKCTSSGSVTGGWPVGGLVGWSVWKLNGIDGIVDSCYSTSSVSGNGGVGGLVGFAQGHVTNSYYAGSVSGGSDVGGLVGLFGNILRNSYYNYDEVLVNGRNMITPGALSAEDFEQWLANNMSLDINRRLPQQNGYYLINNMNDFKQLLIFGQDESLKFRLTTDLDLQSEPDFYIPYLVGEFDGDGHRISNLSLSLECVWSGGLFGYLGGRITRLGVEDASITGFTSAGALVGWNDGIVDNSYSSGGMVHGNSVVGGLVGGNTHGSVTNSYTTSSVSGHDRVGGLVGENTLQSTMSNSYATGSVSGISSVGGLVGRNEGTAGNCFWDVQTSGQPTSAGGTEETTAEMKNIATFSGAGWNIVAVANPSTRNSAYIWNIVDGQTYPFLSWQS